MYRKFTTIIDVVIKLNSISYRVLSIIRVYKIIIQNIITNTLSLNIVFIVVLILLLSKKITLR